MIGRPESMHDLQRIGRSADIGQGLDADRGIDVRNDRMAGIFRLKAAKSFSSHIGEHPASGQESAPSCRGRALAVSAMKYAGEQDDVGVTDCALTERASESPRKSAASCTSGVV